MVLDHSAELLSVAEELGSRPRALEVERSALQLEQQSSEFAARAETRELLAELKIRDRERVVLRLVEGYLARIRLQCRLQECACESTTIIVRNAMLRVLN